MLAVLLLLCNGRYSLKLYSGLSFHLQIGLERASIANLSADSSQ